MGIFNKVKIKKNDRVAYYKFPSKIFTGERIANVCLQTQIDSFFIEVYGLTQNDISAIKSKLFDDGIEIIVNPIKQEELTIICIPVLKIKDLLTYAVGLDFAEILIWDCYTTIEQFLQDKQNITNSKKDESKFFLDYNKYENGYAELYLAPIVDSQDIQKILSE